MKSISSLFMPTKQRKIWKTCQSSRWNNEAGDEWPTVSFFLFNGHIVLLYFPSFSSAFYYWKLLFSLQVLTMDFVGGGTISYYLVNLSWFFFYHLWMMIMKNIFFNKLLSGLKRRILRKDILGTPASPSNKNCLI